ncbi:MULTISPECIES: phosphotransferase enzyme family protein [unclassified Luteococcus]|uniref:phosphotransferase enzyme family protein n=1 Tax=unclassified Luteococcus TaxID=2639923 RepID=UPI00313EC25B
MGDDRGAVVVMGDVVRRPAGPWSPTVHSLLRHLVGKGAPVPEPLELHSNHELLRVVPGDGGTMAWPHQTTIASVRSAGRLLRSIHDATLDWTPPANAQWSVTVEGGPVICHGDPKPPNMTWRDGRAIGLFDWDTARPAERISDVAYALYWIAPFDVDAAELDRRGLHHTIDAWRRIDAFLDGYAWDETIDIMAEVTARRRLAVREVVEAARAGIEPQAGWLADGIPSAWIEAPRLPTT